jgi:hypothetical protein
MLTVRPFLWGAITLMTAGSLFLVYRSADRALTQHLGLDVLFLSEIVFLLLCGWALLSFLFRKAQRSAELVTRFMLGFSFCLFLNLAVQSGLLLARHIH